jgi:hypothetical protein
MNSTHANNEIIYRHLQVNHSLSSRQCIMQKKYANENMQVQTKVKCCPHLQKWALRVQVKMTPHSKLLRG